MLNVNSRTLRAGDLVAARLNFTDSKYHVWEVGLSVDSALRSISIFHYKSMCGLKHQHGMLNYNDNIWEHLEKFRGVLCKKCRWEEARAAVILGRGDT